MVFLVAMGKNTKLQKPCRQYVVSIVFFFSLSLRSNRHFGGIDVQGFFRLFG